MRCLEDRLVWNGQLLREHHLKGQSINSRGFFDADIVLNARREAFDRGYTMDDITRLEWIGETGQWSLRLQPYEVEFVGLETLPSGWNLRSYYVTGDHKLTRSTVGVMELAHHGIFPTEINMIRFACEYIKEALILGWYKVAMWMHL